MDANRHLLSQKGCSQTTEDIFHVDPETVTEQEVWDQLHTALTKTLKDSNRTGGMGPAPHCTHQNLQGSCPHYNLLHPVPPLWINITIRSSAFLSNKKLCLEKSLRLNILKGQDWQRFKFLQKETRIRNKNDCWHSKTRSKHIKDSK